VAALTVPARSELRMSPEGADLLVTGVAGLRAGQQVEFTLRFRRSPDLRVRALVVPAGGLPHIPEISGNSTAPRSG